MVVLLSVFVLGGAGGQSASGLWRGDDVSQLWWWCCCRFLFWGAQGGQSASGLWRGDDVSQLWWWCCCRFLFWGAQGASQLGCEGEGGPVSFGVVLFCGEWRRVSFRGLWRGDDVSQLWWWCCCRFLFWGAQGASQLPGCEGEGGPVSFGVVLFCGEWRRVSFRGLWRGDDVSQLWWWCCCRFLFWGAQGASQLPGGA